MPTRSDWFDLPDRPLGIPDVAILGLPYDGSVSRKAGAARAPDALRRLSRTAEAVDRRGRELLGLTVRDYGDVAPFDREGHPRAPAEFFEAVRARLDEIPRGAFPIILGGDNSVSIPAMEWFAGRAGGEVGVVWFDAHPDLFDAYDGKRDSHACALRRGMERGGIPSERVVLLGTRSFSSEERSVLDGGDFGLITAADHAAAPDETADRIAERLGGCSAVYLAIDIDGFDASCAPGTGYPMPGGIGAEAFFATLERLMDRLPIDAVDLTEIAPPLDVNDVTAFLGTQVVMEVLSGIWRRRVR